MRDKNFSFYIIVVFGDGKNVKKFLYNIPLYMSKRCLWERSKFSFQAKNIDM